MREILFRGKRVDNGEWIEGWYGKKSFGAWPLRDAITPCVDAENGYLHYEEISPETVGQYTGLNDMHGKRIFEGDLVKAVLPGNSGRLPFVWPISPVVYKGSRFGLDMNKNTGGFVSLDGFAPAVTCEVIGNIHDHPEMIGGVSDGV